MLYRFLHLILRFWLRIHFRRIYKTGFENIPATGPVILACNHPNSFLDAVVVALLSKRPVNFLARSDVFRKKWAAWILAQLNMIPIYRLQEGMENLEKNQGTFKKCFEILAKGEVLLIFSEGICVLEKRLRPLKKGTARIAFGAEELYQFQLNLKIVPLALTYTRATEFRSELFIVTAAGFSIKHLQSLWHEEPARAIRTFNEQLSPLLENNLLVIPDKKTEKQAEWMLELGRSQLSYPLFKTFFHGRQRLQKEQHWMEQLFKLPTDSWTERIRHLKEVHKHIGIPLDSALTKKPAPLFFLLTGLLIALPSLVLHGLPLWLSQKITQKTVRDAKFKSSVQFGTSAIFSYLWYLIIFLVLVCIKPILLPLVLLLPWMAYLSILWWEALQHKRWNTQRLAFKKMSEKAYQSWQEERSSLLRAIEG